MQEEFEVEFSSKPIRCVRYGKTNTSSEQKLIFTHGAGGTLESPGTANFTAGFSEVAPILCFQGSLNLKARVKMFSAVIDSQDFSTNLGGRSMGARSAVAAIRDSTECLILVSYPLSGSKDKRDQVLLDLPASIRVLFVIGDRDSMCDLDELRDVRQKMKCDCWIVTVKGADHGMNMKPKSATELIGKKTGEVAARWLLETKDTPSDGHISWSEEDEEVKWTGWTKTAARSQSSTTIGESSQRNRHTSNRKSKGNGTDDTPKSTRKRKRA